MTVAERIRRARRGRGLSQRALAREAGMSTGYVTQIERGGDESFSANGRIENPRLESMERLARVLDTPVEWLAFGVGEEPEWKHDPTAPEEGAA